MPPEVTEFIRRLLAEMPISAISRATGIDRKTLWRWSAGHRRPTQAMVERVIDAVLPQRGSGPIYTPDMAIDGDTWVGGVGEYSLRAASGKMIELEEPCSDNNRAAAAIVATIDRAYRRSGSRVCYAAIGRGSVMAAERINHE